jgi:tetratricopeptide (TPR) repeat protein
MDMYRRRKHRRRGWAPNFSFVRGLAASLWIRVVFVVLILFVLLLALAFPRIWRTSPPAVKPVIKISGLDYVQAWALKRSARKETVAGQTERALFAWRAAVEHNPADVTAVRGLMSALLQGQGTQDQLSLTVRYSMWLLQLTQTNQSSVELVARVGDRLGLYAWVVELLEPMERKLTPDLEVVYLKALFHTRQFQRYAARWSSLDPRLQMDSELALYQDAYQLGWGPSSARADARRRLTAAIIDPKTKTTAARLMMTAATQLGDVILYERAFLTLSEEHRTTLTDNVVLWRLLAQSGRRSEAVERALAYPGDPVNASEVMTMADGYVAIGQRTRAKQLLQRYATTFSQAEGIWIGYANLLMESQSWEELFALALQIRNSPGVQDSLVGYSYFLEGRSHLARLKQEMAEVAFKKAADVNYDNQVVGLATASGLVQLGFPALALKLLDKWRTDLGQNPEYWRQLCMVAYQTKQSDLLQTAARTAYDLAPEDPNVMNNYAAALLIARERPEEAIGITFQLLARTPNALPALVNHSLALVRNGRAAEAAEILQKINPDRLSEVEAASYYMILFETAMALKQYDLARQADARITSRFLFPVQIDWWMQERQKIPTAASTPAATGATPSAPAPASAPAPELAPK